MLYEKQIVTYYKKKFEVFPAIIRLTGKKKCIITPKGTSWKERLSLETAIQWLRVFNGKANALCLKTGACSSVTVIDDDNRNGIHPYLLSFIAEETPHSITGSGGHHFFFKYDASISTSACSSEKIDIRNDGGLIIIPPSCFEGREYFWINAIGCTTLNPMPLALKEFILGLHKPSVAPTEGRVFKSYTQLSRKQRTILDDYIERSRHAQTGIGDRSACDFALCCWAVKIGLKKDELWKMVSNIGKFAQRGREYFNLTFQHALERAR